MALKPLHKYVCALVYFVYVISVASNGLLYLFRCWGKGLHQFFSTRTFCIITFRFWAENLDLWEDSHGCKAHPQLLRSQSFCILCGESGNQTEESFGEAERGRESRERNVSTQSGSGSKNFGCLCAHTTSNCLVAVISFRPKQTIFGCVPAKHFKSFLYLTHTSPRTWKKKQLFVISAMTEVERCLRCYWCDWSTL